MAKILKDRFLTRLAKQLTFASREFENEESFTLVTPTLLPVTDVVADTFTDESDDIYATSPIENTHIQTNTVMPTSEIVFNAEFDVVTEGDILKGTYGNLPIGACVITINSAELANKSITEELLKRSSCILFAKANAIDAYGKATTLKTSIYYIKKVTPMYLKNRMIEIQVHVSLSKDDESD